MAKLVGKIDGLSRRQCNDLQALSDILIAKGEVLSEEFAEAMLKISYEIKKEVAVFINRSGRVLLISVGKGDHAPVYELHQKRWQHAYAGVSCVHTHLSGQSRLSDADLSALQNLRYDCMVALTEKNDCIDASVAMLMPTNGSLIEPEITLVENLSLEQFLALPIFQNLLSFESSLQRQATISTNNDKERAILILQPQQNDRDTIDIAKEELCELADTAGLIVVKVVVQVLKRNQRKLGRGKLEEIAMLIQNENADVVVFDQELTPSYNQMVSDFLGVKVIDKTVLILDIFAQRARSKDGKLQVELAQLNYLLPRLTGMGTALSRLGGGVGTRGPGETQLETDRRHIRRRIHYITQELESIKSNRNLQRSNRSNYQGLQLAMVGYTNAGKTTLLNKLTDDHIYAANQLFATLDPTTRQLHLENGLDMLISDTVGFIRDLPNQLLDAFKATLEELQYADILLHVVDVSKEGVDERIQVVEDVLVSLGLDEKKCILVCNKIDQCEEFPLFTSALQYENKCYISCVAENGIAPLLKELENIEANENTELTINLPFDNSYGKMMALVRQNSRILSEEYDEKGAVLKVEMKRKTAEKLFPNQI